MKIYFIFGKGIDGCGVTRGAILFEKWLVKNGNSTHVLDFDNKQKMLRAKNSSFLGNISRVEANDIDVSEEIISDVNSSDIVIFHSYPTKKQDEYVERFRRFVEKIKNPVIVMHDHGVTQQTINSVPQAGEIFSYADVLVTQSEDGLSREAFTSFDSGLGGRVVENPIWFETESLDEYRLKFDDRSRSLIYLGRTSVIKDPCMICRIEPFLPEEWRLSMVGCERSISFFPPQDILRKRTTIFPSNYISDYKKKILYYSLDKNGNYKLSNWGSKREDIDRIEILDQYKYTYGMERLGKSLASWCGYKLGDHKEYGRRMEYTMIESFLLSLPIINRHFAENAYSPEGKLWVEYSGPLVSQRGEEEKLAGELIRISESKSEWEERTDASRSLIKRFNDIEVLAPKFLEDILSMGKRTDKRDPLDLISRWFPDAKKYREEGHIVMSNTTNILKSIPTVLESGKQVQVK